MRCALCDWSPSTPATPTFDAIDITNPFRYLEWSQTHSEYQCNICKIEIKKVDFQWDTNS